MSVLDLAYLSTPQEINRRNGDTSDDFFVIKMLPSYFFCIDTNFSPQAKNVGIKNNLSEH